MKCSRCEQPFEEVPGKLYCSEDCRYRAKKSRRRQKTNKQFTCEQCKKDFWRNPDRGHIYRFCSLQCAGAAIRKPEVEPFRRECAGCAKAFSTFRPNQRYCTPTCSTELACQTCFTFFTIHSNERGKQRKYCSRGCFPNPRAHPTGNRVYFILAVGLQRVKVGFSGEFAERFDAIRTQEADEIQVLGTISGDQEKEQSIHRELDALGVRAHHEWFDFRPQAVKSLVDRYLYPTEGDPNEFPTEGRPDDPPTRPPCEEEVLFGRICQCTCLHTVHPVENHGPACPEQFSE